jgi:hypothetical protein
MGHALLVQFLGELLTDILHHACDLIGGVAGQLEGAVARLN